MLIKEILSGKEIAYISDAGTPGISDPGAYLVKKALESKIKVVPIPGASSITTALSTAGIVATQFNFYGFLPNTDSKSRKVIKQFQYCGIVEAIRISRAGYPIRISHHDFLNDFYYLFRYLGFDVQIEYFINCFKNLSS